jgi:hypothetical protein
MTRLICFQRCPIYYLDRRDDREAWMDVFWSLADWEFAAANPLKSDQVRPDLIPPSVALHSSSARAGTRHF